MEWKWNWMEEWNGMEGNGPMEGRNAWISWVGHCRPRARAEWTFVAFRTERHTLLGISH